MTNFTGKLISNTYKSLLTINASTTGTGVTTSLVGIQTADGTQTAIKIATNKAHISGNFGVSGNLSVQNKVCASAYFGDGSNLTGLTASIGGSISVGNALIDGTVTVTGTAIFKDDVSVSGALNVAGNTSIGGTLVNTGAGTFSSTVTVVGKGTFKDDVSVSGGLGVKGNVSVEGNTSLGGTLGVAGAGTFTSKTEFKDDVSVSGNLDVAGNVSVGGTAIFNSNVSVSGNANVNGNVTALFFYGDGRNLSNVEAELGVTSNISVSGFINAGGAVSITGTFAAVGAATFKDDVSVSGNVVIGGTVTISGTNVQAANAKVCASAYFGDGSNLTGITTSIEGNISVNNATIGGNLFVGGTATVAGATHLQSTLSVAGNVSVGGTLITTGAGTFSSTVTVVGNTALKSAVTVGGAANFGSTVTVASNVSIGGTGTVGGTFAVSGGAIDLRTSASDPAYVRFYCESNNAHYAQLRSPPHASYSGNIIITLPNTTVTLIGTSTTNTLTNKTFGDNTKFSSTVTVVGAAHLQSTVSVGGAATFASTVTVVGAGTFKDDVSVSGNSVLGGTLRVVGATSIEGAAILKSTATVVGAAHLQSTVSVGGAATFASTVTVVGATHLKSTVTVGGAANFASTVTVVGAVHLQSTVSVAGAARLDTIELGAASDTTLARASAGNVNIEGNLVYRAGGTDVPVADGGTGASTFAANGILFGNGTSAVGATAVGTANQILTSNGSGSAPTFQDAGGGALWNLIGTAVADDSASLTISGLSATYDYYVCIVSDMKTILTGTSSVNLWMRFGDSSGIRSGSSDYAWSLLVGGAYANYATQKSGTQAYMQMTASQEPGGEGNEGLGVIINIPFPSDSTTSPSITGESVYLDEAGDLTGTFFHAGMRNVNITFTQVQVLYNTGNIESGRFSVYGISHS